MYAGLLGSDILALSFALWISILIRKQFPGSSAGWTVYYSILPGLLAVAILIYIFQGQYQLGGIDVVTELRTLSMGTCLTFLLLTAFTFFSQTSLAYSRIVFLLSWMFALVFVPVSRFLLRVVSGKLNIWGEPVLILGDGDTTDKVVRYIKNKTQMGWRPLVVIGADPKTHTKKYLGKIPYLQAENNARLSQYLNLYKINTVIIVQNDVPQNWVERVHKPSCQHIRKIVVIPSFNDIHNTIVKTHNIAGTLGLEVQQNLLITTGRFVKRIMDIGISVFFGAIALPITGVTAIFIKVDSPGPVFYKQTRIGYDGKPFAVWKFRTMVRNADQILERYLQEHPELRAEWDADHKIKNDPRITHLGKILRKTSLDELPQLWNVIIGEMSMVGPRPIVESEIGKYGKSFELYKQAKPGITGLWQVSGRNNTTYEERVYYDGYYVQNWSIWLDIYILIKTVWVVISRDGAY
jgi:Undecaprenyl-phosphate galactose phosphotransferase WbaP